MKTFVLGAVLLISGAMFAQSANFVVPGPGDHRKVCHLLGGFYLGTMGSITGHENWGLAAGFTVGVGKEIYDNYHGEETRSGHVKDVAITTAGAVIPWATVKLWKHYHKPHTSYYGGRPAQAENLLSGAPK